MDHFFDWHRHTGTQEEKVYKTTLWQGDHLMVGLNCLQPGQSQKIHAHDGADKFYVVLEGSGQFTVGDVELKADTGSIVIAPAGIPHGVTNEGNERLSLLVAIAPPPK